MPQLNIYARQGEAVVRPNAPLSTDEGLVVRPIGGGGGGAIIVEPIAATTSTVTSTANTAGAKHLLVADATRIGFAVFNSSTADTLFLLLNNGAVTSSFYTVALVPGAYYEDPFRYTGDVFGIWGANTNGAALVTDFHP